MAVPKKKTSKSRRGMRQSRKKAIEPVGFAVSKRSGVSHLPHHVDKDGYYNGRLIFTTVSEASGE